MVRTITALGIVLILFGAAAMLGPTFGFSTIAGDRDVSVGTADTSSGFLAIDETNEVPDNDNDAVVVEITNNAPEFFDSLDTDVSIDTPNLVISDGFDEELGQGDSTGLELTCSGDGGGTATIQISSSATGQSLSIEGVNFSRTFTYDCSGGDVTADAGGPYGVHAGDAVQLDGTGSTTQRGNIQSYNWEIIEGDGSLTGSDTAEPTYTAPAEIDGETDVTVSLTVTTNQGESSTDTSTITIREEDGLIASFTADRKGNSNNVDLDASPYRGDITEYAWDIGNDGEIDSRGMETGVSVERGEEVKLIVSNDSESDSIVRVVD